MRYIIVLITGLLLLFASGCSQDEPVPVKYNENDLSVLREIYGNMGVKWPQYPCDFDNPDKMVDVTWEIIDGEYRVVKFKPLSYYIYNLNCEAHELTSRIGELVHLHYFACRGLRGEIPCEIYNCPLDTLILGGYSDIDRNTGTKVWYVRGGIYPEISKVANTLKYLAINGIDLGMDGKELECIFECPKLDHVDLENTNLIGEVSARYGDQNYSYFNLQYNHFTSCDSEIFRGKGSIFPHLFNNDIYCEVPYSLAKEAQKVIDRGLVDDYKMSYNSDKGIGFRIMPPETNLDIE